MDLKTLINNSQTFAVLLGHTAKEHEILLKEALLSTISGKNLPVFSLPEHKEEEIILKERWSEFLTGRNTIALPQKTSIRLPKEKYRVKEVSYKEDGDYISLIITSENGNLFKEDITLQKLPPSADAVFCFFDNEEILENFNGKILLPDNENIVFISESQQNKTLSEKIYEIALLFDDNILNKKDIATLFLASLIIETDNFSEKTKEAIGFGSFLLKNGGDHIIVASTLNKDKNTSFAQLLGRTLARTFVDENMNVSWSFLNSRDFQKTNNVSTEPTYLFKLLKKLKNYIQPQKFHILLWQSIDGIKTLVAKGQNTNEKELTSLAAMLGTFAQSDFFIAGPFEKFSKAEIVLKEALKEIKK